MFVSRSVTYVSVVHEFLRACRRCNMSLCGTEKVTGICGVRSEATVTNLAACAFCKDVTDNGALKVRT